MQVTGEILSCTSFTRFAIEISRHSPWIYVIMIAEKGADMVLSDQG